MGLLRKSLSLCKYIDKRLYSQTVNPPSASSAAAGAAAGAAGGEAGGAAGGAPELVLTGLQPTGALHVGNYYCVLRRAARLQAAGHHVLLCVADLHSLTAPAPGALSERVLAAAAAALAAGLDPARATLWPQSAVPRHAELCWVLACVASVARLSHMPQYRSATGEDRAGRLLYPLLQAADVLLMGARLVPVGADQLQHLQLAAQLARSARSALGLPLTVPRALLPEDGSDRIRSLRDPLRKMSKSDPDRKSRILLTDSDADVRLKVRKAVTDCNPEVTFEPEARPGVANLVRLHCLAAGLLPEEAVEEAAGLTTAQYKDVVAAALCAELAGVRARLAELSARPEYVRAVLRAGAAAARRRADRTWARVAERLQLAPASIRRADTEH